jgi:hypothetical protein
VSEVLVDVSDVLDGVSEVSVDVRMVSVDVAKVSDDMLKVLKNETFQECFYLTSKRRKKYCNQNDNTQRHIYLAWYWYR